MNTQIDERDVELIDLGAASEETKGSGLKGNDIVGRQALALSDD